MSKAENTIYRVKTDHEAVKGTRFSIFLSASEL